MARSRGDVAGPRRNVELKASDPDRARSLVACEDIGAKSHGVLLRGARRVEAALLETLGMKAVIAKERRLYLWEGVRIHLDRVDGLGDFIEFEAIADPDSDLSREQAKVLALRQAFEIDEARLVARSYCDMATTEN